MLCFDVCYQQLHLESEGGSLSEMLDVFEGDCD